MIIALSGKSLSGKDTVGQIIQYLISMSKPNHQSEWTWDCHIDISRFDIKKFAYKVKEITSLLTGIPIADLEKEEVKNNVLPECWNTYGYADGLTRDDNGNPIMTVKYCDKEEYLLQYRTNWRTAYKYEMTVRRFMYQLATDAIRKQLHPDTWVNALFSEYDTMERWKMQDKPSEYDKYPNWIITDWRFENEGKAILERKGITIRIERFIDLRYPKEWEDFTDYVGDNPINEDYFMDYCKYDNPKLYNHLTHQSETELDKYVNTDYFKYTIYNNGDIENLIAQCYDILLKEKLV